MGPGRESGKECILTGRLLYLWNEDDEGINHILPLNLKKINGLPEPGEIGEIKNSFDFLLSPV